MLWKNSWFQLAALVAVITGGLLAYDLGTDSFSTRVAETPTPSSPAPSSPSNPAPVQSPQPSKPAPAAPVYTPPTPTPAPVTPTPVAPSQPVGPVAGQEWYNTLGMKFVPAGTDGVLFCTWDVRVKDFQAYAQATGYRQTGGINVMKVITDANGSRPLNWVVDPNASWENPGFDQEPTHPVVGVSWNEAIAFCEWLTKKERVEGKLGSHQMYRLPTDAEWSIAVGDGKYPWGEVWPPPDGAGNYGDQAFVASLPGTGWPSVPINDGFARTSPVGRFRPNAYGLYDMGGNVWQWCQDQYVDSASSSSTVGVGNPILDKAGPDGTYKILRGGAWMTTNPSDLFSAHRTYSGSGGA